VPATATSRCWSKGHPLQSSVCSQALCARTSRRPARPVMHGVDRPGCIVWVERPNLLQTAFGDAEHSGVETDTPPRRPRLSRWVLAALIVPILAIVFLVRTGGGTAVDLYTKRTQSKTVPTRSRSTASTRPATSTAIPPIAMLPIATSRLPPLQARPRRPNRRQPANPPVIKARRPPTPQKPPALCGARSKYAPTTASCVGTTMTGPPSFARTTPGFTPRTRTRL